MNTNRSISIFLFFLAIHSLVACTDPEAIDYPRPAYNDSAANAAAAAGMNPAGQVPGQLPGQPGAQQAALNGPAPKINPAHGQPGHRCDIAVGAPLDGSAPAPQVAGKPVVTQNPVQLSPTISQVSTTPVDANPVATPDNPVNTDKPGPSNAPETPAKPESPAPDGAAQPDKP